MKINVTADIKEVTRFLDNISKRQIPFAASQALNDTIFGAQSIIKTETPRRLDRPTPFTVKGYRVIKSSKRNLEAVIYIDSSRMKYLQDVVIGGRKVSERKGMAIPVNARLNQYGNIPNKRKGLVKNKRQFIGVVKGTLGVWERTNKNRRVKLMVALRKEVTHKERLPFHSIIDTYVKRTFVKRFNERFIEALKTAK